MVPRFGNTSIFLEYEHDAHHPSHQRRSYADEDRAGCAPLLRVRILETCSYCGIMFVFWKKHVP